MSNELNRDENENAICISGTELSFILAIFIKHINKCPDVIYRDFLCSLDAVHELSLNGKIKISNEELDKIFKIKEKAIEMYQAIKDI